MDSIIIDICVYVCVCMLCNPEFYSICVMSEYEKLGLDRFFWSMIWACKKILFLLHSQFYGVRSGINTIARPHKSVLPK
jgi:hypothetical protein